jgi:soluble P-type ATPase
LTADTPAPGGHRSLSNPSIPSNLAVKAKGGCIRETGAEHVVAIGQGANDAEMLKTAGLGICVLSVEGTAVEALLNADLVVSNIFDALHLFENPIRIVASLRK